VPKRPFQTAENWNGHGTVQIGGKLKVGGMVEVLISVEVSSFPICCFLTFGLLTVSVSHTLSVGNRTEPSLASRNQNPIFTRK
jgi:hypothetical protein